MRLPMASVAAMFPVVLLLLSSWFAMPVIGYQLQDAALEELIQRRSSGAGRPGAADPAGRNRKGIFVLGKPKQAVKTDAGEIRVISGPRWKGDQCPMLISFVHMEPNSLSVPQYAESNIILFLRVGEAKVGWIHKEKLVERKLKRGDVSVIPSGSAFYIVNAQEKQKSQLICSIDTSQSSGYTPFHTFFLGGGADPTSVLSGFDVETLANALNITIDEFSLMMRKQTGGPIISYHRATNPTQVTDFKLGDDEEEDEEEEDDEDEGKWTIGNFIKYLLGMVGESREGGRRKSTEGVSTSNYVHRLAPRPYNLYEAEPGFENEYGWSTAIDEHEYSSLKDSGVGVYLVNLTAGTMLAPHYNPVATEYGVVLRGSGRVQVVFPNGTSAMDAEVSPGDVFWIPRFFPFCQLAAPEAGGLEFFGFTKSSRRNHPQFLAGATSTLQSMAGPELAAAFGVSEERLRRLVGARGESVILPWNTTTGTATHHREKELEKEMEKEKEKEKDQKLKMKVEERVAIRRGFSI